jgi:Mce-associated membrane protein
MSGREVVMSPRKRRSAVLDADASIEDVEAAAAEAQARAFAARVRADTLRRQVGKLDDKTVVEKIRDWPRPRWLRWPSAKLLAVAAAAVLICASLTVTVVMVLHHRHVVRDQRRAAEFSAAAQQSVVTMMTIDPATVQQNIKDVIANSAGKFKSALEAGEADELVKGAQQSKVSTKATVRSVAVESMTENSAVVLVAATSEGTTPDNTKLPAASWRISLTLQRENGQIKTSEFEFVR